jgi:hypothetical protein
MVHNKNRCCTVHTVEFTFAGLALTPMARGYLIDPAARECVSIWQEARNGLCPDFCRHFDDLYLQLHCQVHRSFHLYCLQHCQFQSNWAPPRGEMHTQARPFQWRIPHHY